MASPGHKDPKQASHVQELRKRLNQCWELDVDWKLYPSILKEGCKQVGMAISMSPTAVLAGLILIVGFTMSHSVVKIEGTDWMEPVLLWLSICMPTGMGKSSLCKFLRNRIKGAKALCGLEDNSSQWLCDDQSFEKMGDLMSQNHWKLLGLYDELPMFFSQINVLRARGGVSDSHELSVFLQLYGGEHWMRKTVSGDSNFNMGHTGLTVGGFTQPTVAKNIISNPSNCDKGLCQRFLWLIPKPMAVSFEQLQQVDKEFCTSIEGLMAAMWKDTEQIRHWTLMRPCVAFRKKYDIVKDQLLEISCSDDLLSGMLSKSRGQVLRVAATLHALFNIETPQQLPTNIADDAIVAAVNFVEVCNQHVAFLSGMGDIDTYITSLQEMQTVNAEESKIRRNASFALLLPGRVLHLSALIVARKFRDRGNKAGALEAMQHLEDCGMGKLLSESSNRGTDKIYTFQKIHISENIDEKTKLVENLSTFGISLTQYKASLDMDEITLDSIAAKKRAKQPHTPLRSSPRGKHPRLTEDEVESPSSRKQLKL